MGHDLPGLGRASHCDNGGPIPSRVSLATHPWRL